MVSRVVTCARDCVAQADRTAAPSVRSDPRRILDRPLLRDAMRTVVLRGVARVHAGQANRRMRDAALKPFSCCGVVSWLAANGWLAGWRCASTSQYRLYQ
jgi:hypothetical protein